MADLDVVDIIFKINREIGEMNTTLQAMQKDQQSHAARVIKNQARFHVRLISLETSRTYGRGFMAAVGFGSAALWQLISGAFRH